MHKQHSRSKVIHRERISNTSNVFGEKQIRTLGNAMSVVLYLPLLSTRHAWTPTRTMPVAYPASFSASAIVYSSWGSPPGCDGLRMCVPSSILNVCQHNKKTLKKRSNRLERKRFGWFISHPSPVGGICSIPPVSSRVAESWWTEL